ncbi:MAG: DUF402 domain-containing protein [Ktedonobacterales bacterium]
MQLGDQIVVYKLNTQGIAVVNYPAECQELLPNGVRLVARWTSPGLELGYTSFETGDRFCEWFFTDHWYNIFAVASPSGELKGWYCNIAEPARIDERSVTSLDLQLDLWVDKNYGMTVLDEDEFASDQFLTTEMRRQARQALDELRSRVNQRQPPFNSFDLHQDLW